MTEREKKMEQCSHAWIYSHCGNNDDVYLCCPYCGMERLAMPGETAHLVNRELKIRHDEVDGDV